MSKKIFEDDPKSKGSQYVQLGVVLLVVAIVAYLIIKFVMSFIWWILSVLGILVFIINRKFVFKILKGIRNLYKKNTWMGVGATLGSFFALPVFTVFLFLKTIWDFRNSDFLPTKSKESNRTVDAEATVIDIEDPEEATWDKNELPPDKLTQ